MEKLQKIEIINTLFNHANEGIIVANTRGIIQLVNPAAGRMLDYSESELIGNSIDSLVPDHIKPKHQQHREHFQERCEGSQNA
jgi:PAS domain S-box-containing protein